MASAGPKFYISSKSGTNKRAVTPNLAENDDTVALQKFEQGHKNQAWHKKKPDENRSGFAFVNTHTNQVIQAPGEQGKPLVLVSFEEPIKDEMLWIEKALTDEYVSIQPAGSNPNNLCWTVLDPTGADGSLIGIKEFEDGNAAQHWVAKEY